MHSSFSDFSSCVSVGMYPCDRYIFMPGLLIACLAWVGWPGTKGPWRLVSDVVCDMWRWLVQGDRSPVFYEGLGVLVIASYSLYLLSYSYPVFLATCVPFIILVDCGTCSLIVRSVCVTTLDWKGGTVWVTSSVCLMWRTCGLYRLLVPTRLAMFMCYGSLFRCQWETPPLHYALDMMFLLLIL